MMSIDLAKALAIEKGVCAEDLEWLARAAVDCQRIVELGSFHGRSTRAMLDNSQAHLWCIDHWKGSSRGAGHGLVCDEADFEIFLNNVQDVRSRITILKMSTGEAAGLLPKGCFDLVFIDANHAYEAIKFDILHYAPLLCEDGLLCGHDARAGWKGVDRAIEELIMDPREGGAAMWWTVRKEDWLLEMEKGSHDNILYTIGGR